MKLYECTPAMGRDYRSAAAVRADWNANKDFIAHTAFQSTYINKQDADRHGVTVQIYYANRRKAIVIAPTKD